MCTYLNISILYLYFYKIHLFWFTGCEYSIKVPVTKIDFIHLFARTLHFVSVIISSFNGKKKQHVFQLHGAVDVQVLTCFFFKPSSGGTTDQ